MISWLIPKQFCMGLICAGILEGLNTSTILYTRVVYVALSIFTATICLALKLFSKSLYNTFSFLMPSCKDGTCLSIKITHSLMISLFLFHFSVLILTLINKHFSTIVYQKCWPLKFVLYFSILFISAFATTLLDYYFWIAVAFSLVYLVVQCVYSIELAYDWNDSWYNNYQETGSDTWATLLFGFSGISWVTILYFTYKSYSSSYFWFFVALFAISVAITVISSSNLCENGSLLSASATCAGAFYYLATGVLYSQKEMIVEIVLIDVIFSFVILVYIALVYNENNKDLTQERGGRELKDFNKEDDGEMIDERREEQVNYKNFHSILACYAMFLGMVLTNWESQDYDGFAKMVRCGQCAVIILFYSWTLVAPLLFTDRSFF